MPVISRGQDQPVGVLAAGVSPAQKMNLQYRTFYELIASQIATVVANARAYEEERERSESLAELDRAKTAFFSNVSHEFRTPLTLMLGPLEDMVASSTAHPSSPHLEQLLMVHRNGLRLLKLVNSLLDFSRIEAGRLEAAYQPTDMASLTADLASSFRSTMERADLWLRIQCDPIPDPIYIDHDMWEKIVLNLLSNAFKFTFEGGVTVTLKSLDKCVELQVSDTGSGIPKQELPHLFERFHRVGGARGRTHEGTGIGLALVQELVKLHQGTLAQPASWARAPRFRCRFLKAVAISRKIGLERRDRWLRAQSERTAMSKRRSDGCLRNRDNRLTARSGGVALSERRFPWIIASWQGKGADCVGR